jgi:hypothetical protein
MREKLIEKTKEYSAILKPLPTAKIIYLGTPQTEDSIYNKLPETFTTRIWPAEIPTAKEAEAMATSWLHTCVSSWRSSLLALLRTLGGSQTMT